MPSVLSVGVRIPDNAVTQNEAKDLIRAIFHKKSEQMERLMPVFDHAMIEERQFVVPVEWFQNEHTFEERNNIYLTKATNYSIDAINDCLHNREFLSEKVHVEEIDCIIFVSSTGISTPTIDSYIINELHLPSHVVRIPIWGLGCAGGASGLARAYEWLKANPSKTAILVNLEFCSLAFQQDSKKSNFIGAALFGDGVSCCLLAGDESNINRKSRGDKPYIHATSSKIKKKSTDVMGWDIQDNGFQVIFSKSIPALVETFWDEHVNEFKDEQKLSFEEISFYTAHPGGAKVLQAMEKVLGCSSHDLRFSYEILKKHGNMSSPTVHFVLKEAMKSKPPKGTKSLLTALGPGFSSEIMLLEWMEQ
jgi:alkylresorcinol/alkylpyrone synthase